MNKSRERVLPAWSPKWDVTFERWTASQIHKNMWRFDAAEEFNDIMQDAKLLFLTLCTKYKIVTGQGHFFALYKTSLSRMFIDKSRVKQKSAIDQMVDAEAYAADNQLEGNLPNGGYFNVLLDELPDELKMVLKVLTTGRVRLKLDRPTKSFRPRENHNMRLRTKLALTTADPVGALKTYFSHL
jgi:hypothetical protein